MALSASQSGGSEGVELNTEYDPNVICPGFVRTSLVEKQIPEQAQQFGISEEEVIKNIMLRETVDGEFTSTEDVAATVSSSPASQAML